MGSYARAVLDEVSCVVKSRPRGGLIVRGWRPFVPSGGGTEHLSEPRMSAYLESPGLIYFGIARFDKRAQGRDRSPSKSRFRVARRVDYLSH